MPERFSSLSAYSASWRGKHTERACVDLKPFLCLQLKQESTTLAQIQRLQLNVLTVLNNFHQSGIMLYLSTEGQVLAGRGGLSTEIATHGFSSTTVAAATMFSYEL